MGDGYRLSCVNLDLQSGVLSIFSLLEYACFIILCWFLPYNEMNQLNVYMHLLPLGSPTPAPVGHHRMPSRAPYATQQLPAG